MKPGRTNREKKTQQHVDRPAQCAPQAHVKWHVYPFKRKVSCDNAGNPGTRVHSRDRLQAANIPASPGTDISYALRTHPNASKANVGHEADRARV
eukprot:CAMPEP_0174301824 /NCGR_PEP_ID=MMETSP0809-20121228/59274_1 /TAXON_ID=73025 ORGANISM="Eutreptiella gymnastica-like, Strain CCMP1594" /NCGR_SAMPLE_ID=MMETSP0809 /ASSEMBLY_ACC=CAM_ASM_000658 /LENGTH=94 /DNA_ID=CAMNT_0015407639 /DNA_START=1569 /DNA_END=1853 /DNA_ORIENTATION=+